MSVTIVYQGCRCMEPGETERMIYGPHPSPRCPYHREWMLRKFRRSTTDEPTGGEE